MTYFVADSWDWNEAPTFNAAVELALRLERDDRQTEPVQIFEEVDWRACLSPQDRGVASSADFDVVESASRVGVEVEGAL